MFYPFISKGIISSKAVGKLQVRLIGAAEYYCKQLPLLSGKTSGP
jgi:hypothetical protein